MIGKRRSCLIRHSQTSSHEKSSVDSSFQPTFLTQAAKGDQPKKKLLDEVWGEVPPRETTAIMGPSGAGALLLCPRTM